MDVRAVDEAAAADAAASARIRSASLLQEQPGFWHSHRTPRSVNSAITFTRLRRHVRGHHLSSPPTPDVLLRFFDVTMPSRDDVPNVTNPCGYRPLKCHRPHASRIGAAYLSGHGAIWVHRGRERGKDGYV